MEKTKAMCSFGKDDYGLQTGNVKISDLHDFKVHPFKVEQDIQLFELMRSIEDKGGGGSADCKKQSLWGWL